MTASWYSELVLSLGCLSLPPRIVLSFGRDELRYADVDVQSVIADIIAVIERTREIAPEATIYVLECLRGLFRVDLKNGQVDELNAQLHLRLKGLERVQWVEMNKHFIDKYGKLCQRYTYDGLNLTEEGYAKVEEVITNAISGK